MGYMTLTVLAHDSHEAQGKPWMLHLAIHESGSLIVHSENMHGVSLQYRVGKGVSNEHPCFFGQPLRVSFRVDSDQFFLKYLGAPCI